MKKLNITFCSTPDYSSNAKALYEYMVKKYKDSMNYTWIVRTSRTRDRLLAKKINAVLLGSNEFYNYVKKTNVFFTTHCDITNDKPDGSLYVDLWHGVGPKAAGHLMKNLPEKTEKWFEHLSKTLDYMIVPSPFFTTIFSTQFNIKPDRILELGMPKLDYLVHSNGKKNLSKIIDKDLNKYKKILYYMPTFRKGCGRDDSVDVNMSNIFNLKKYDEKILIDYLKKNNYLLCVKYHPSEELIFNNFDVDNVSIIKEEQLEKHNLTINEILNAADLMITDYSSLGTEFLFLNKPVVYITTDFNKYQQQRGVIFEDLNFWTSGYQVQDIEKLKEAINDSLYQNSLSKNISDKKELFFGKLKDGGCKNICNFIFDGNKISKKVKYYNDIETSLEKQVEKLNNENQALAERLNELEPEINKLTNVKDQLVNEINNIYSSKLWKILNLIRNIKNKLLFWKK